VLCVIEEVESLYRQFFVSEYPSSPPLTVNHRISNTVKVSDLCLETVNYGVSYKVKATL
jgi:hypothetical protein